MESKKGKRKFSGSVISYSQKYVAYYLLSFSLLFVITLITLKSSLYLSFPDDDWLAISFARQVPDFARLFRPYGFQSIFFLFLYDFFQDNYFYYYLLGIVLRTIAGMAVLFLSFKLTKNKLMSILAGLLFVTATTGIETNYVIGTMNTYIAIFFSLMFLTYYTTHDVKSIKSYLILSSLFFLSILTAPIRTSGLVLFFFIYEGLKIIKNISKEMIAISLKTIFVITFTTGFMVFSGVFGKTSQVSNSNLSSFLNYFANLSSSIYHGNFTDLKSLLFGLGNSLIPGSVPELSSVVRNYPWKLGLIYVVFTAIIAVYYLIRKFDKDVLLLTVFALWPIVFYLMSYIPIANRGQQYFLSDQRYLLVSLSGFSIFIALFAKKLSTIFNGRLRLFVIAGISLFILIHAFETHKYLSSLANSRNGYFSQAIWKQMIQYVPELPHDRLSYFYFEHEYEDSLVNDTLLVGFSNHASVVYNLPKASPPIHPHATDSFDVLRSVVQSGQALVPHGYEPVPLPWDHIYSFRIEGNRLIDIREDVAQRLAVDEL